jgi:hypothetical protein
MVPEFCHLMSKCRRLWTSSDLVALMVPELLGSLAQDVRYVDAERSGKVVLMLLFL